MCPPVQASHINPFIQSRVQKNVPLFLYVRHPAHSSGLLHVISCVELIHELINGAAKQK